MKHYLKTVEETLSEFKTSAEGLTAAEAAERLQRDGRNKLAEPPKDSLIQKAYDAICRPYDNNTYRRCGYIGSDAFYAKESFADVIIILAVVIINAVLGVYQESKAEKAIEALQEMAAATSKVYRDGKLITIRSEELVPGDIVVLEAGDAVPADGRIIQCASMKIEEAALTGESVPVDKTEDALDLGNQKEIPLGDRRNMVYMGSTVVYGRGMAVVCETGMNTEMGKIADALAQAKEGKTPLR